MATLIPTKIVVNASGTPAGGVYPHFRVLVDGVKVGEAKVGAASKAYAIDTKVAAGADHRVQVHFDNDAVIRGQDRNLTVASVKVGEKTMLPTDAGVTYDRYALDGHDVIAGRSMMAWNGALGFKVPASAFPDPSSPVPTPTPSPAPPPTPTTPPPPAPVPSVPSPPTDPAAKAYYVSPQGKDTWSGKLAAPNAAQTDGPVASLGKAAQLARDDSTIDTVLLRGGTYHQTSAVTLQAADSGVTIKAFGNESPVLDGGGQLYTLVQLVNAHNVTLTGLTFANGHKDGFGVILHTADNNRIGDNDFTGVGTAVKLYDASGSAIAGNRMSHLGGFGVEIDGGGGNKVYANRIDHVGEANTRAAGVGGHGSSHNTVAFNDIEYSARYGVSFKDFGPAEPGTDNAVLHNRILHTNTAGGDTGAIEFLGRSNVMHNHRVEGNYIEDTGGQIKENNIGSAGIYLDDLTNGTTVKGNFVKDTSWTEVQIHGGDKNIVENNTFIVSGDHRAAAISDNGNIISEGSKADGNVVAKNVVYSEVFNDRPWWLNHSGVNPVDNNLLYNVAQMPGVDEHSVFADPQFKNAAAGDYSLSATSPATAVGIVGLDWAHMGAVGYDPGTAASLALPKFWE